MYQTGSSVHFALKYFVFIEKELIYTMSSNNSSTLSTYSGILLFLRVFQALNFKVKFKYFKHLVQTLDNSTNQQPGCGSPGFQRDCTGRSRTLRGVWWCCPLLCLLGHSHSSPPEARQRNLNARFGSECSKGYQSLVYIVALNCFWMVVHT